MKVEYKRFYMEYPGAYLKDLKPGLYLVGTDDRIILVGKGNIAISLNSFYVYEQTEWFDRVRPVPKGNQVILTSE